MNFKKIGHPNRILIDVDNAYYDRLKLSGYPYYICMIRMEMRWIGSRGIWFTSKRITKIIWSNYLRKTGPFFLLLKTIGMETIKKWETFSLFLVFGIVAAGSFLKSIPIALLIFGFGLLVQGYIIYLYKKNDLLQVYLKNKAGALIGGILLLGFFLLKDGIWRVS